jgi:DNA-binding NarL/FixJ family response regulator
MVARTATSRDSVPIEGLDWGIQATNALRTAGITSIGKLRDLLDGKDEVLRILDAPDGNRKIEFLLSRDVQEDLKAQLAVFDKSGPVPFATLTRLETKVRALVCEGRLDNDIAIQLGINQKMVQAQLRNILRKMKGRCAPYSA